MTRSLTTRQLISAVRSLIDEQNEAEIDDSIDILPSLNRGLDDAVDILSRRYPDALIKSLAVPLSEGVDGVFDIPEDAYQQRLEKVEANQNNYYYEITRLDYRDITSYDTPSSATIPSYYSVIGSQYKIIPKPSDIDELRIWYIPEQGPLVPEYGRITATGIDNALPTPRSYATMTDIADVNLISTDLTSLEAYVNLIDGRTGEIKATLQVSTKTNSKLIFSASPSRSNVQGRPVSSSLPASAKVDDYICPVYGTCIPPMRSPLTNFLITYASAELKALKLDGDPNVVLNQLKRFEERIEKTWVRREQSTRVGKASRVWSGRANYLWSRTPRG